MKVFRIYDDSEERYYSDVENDVEERLYSTGDETLDELLERAFCEGYEYAQREYATRPENKASKNAYMIAQANALPDRDHLKKNGSFNLKEARFWLSNVGQGGNGTYLDDTRKMGVNPLMARINARGNVSTDGIQNGWKYRGKRVNTTSGVYASNKCGKHGCASTPTTIDRANYYGKKGK